MEKKYYILLNSMKSFKTYEEAETQAKRLTAQTGCGAPSEYVVAVSIAVTKLPIPEIEVVKVT